MEGKPERTNALDRYLSPLDVWGMAFGVIVGWGVFAMPGNTFLPLAGPAGTVIAMLIGMLIGMAVMLVIGGNLSYLMGRSAITGGIYSYTKEAFGRDHAFLSSWFLCLSYLIVRNELKNRTIHTERPVICSIQITAKTSGSMVDFV